MILKTKFYYNFKETQQMIENDIYEERWWYVFVIRIVMNENISINEDELFIDLCYTYYNEHEM